MALLGPKHVVIKGKYITSLYTCHNSMYITTQFWTISPLHPRTSMGWCI